MISKNILIALSAVICLANARTFHPDSFSFDDDLLSGRSYKTEVNDGPPPHEKYAEMARYIVHRSDWTSMGTNSLQFPGFPMVNIISIADSPKNAKSTGNIYFYLTDLDYTGKDLSEDNKLTIMLSQDQDMSCRKANTDSMEPTCARIMMTGSIKKIVEGEEEFNFAREAMFSRHPAAKKWIATHKFYLCKLMIDNIVVLDYYGGPNYVKVEDYYNANYDWSSTNNNDTDTKKSIKKDFVKADSDEFVDDNTVYVKIHKEIEILKKYNK
ncbi:protein CREG1 [Culicoides brevitarsis]|uniref:protein CREG1 n=1 Tax=Culicoides brevitarsis TaxID=469753 RepID=UPI00307C7821